jgi:5-formyltetrahydrofolate cyclo-ligase
MEGDAMSAATISLVKANQQALRQAKRSLRKQMAIQLDALSPSSIALQSSQIASHILAHNAFKKADKISIYVSMEKGEVKTEELCRQTLALGKRLYVPKFASMAEKGMGTTTFERDMKMLRVKDWDDFEAMVMNKWGIREPEEIVANNKREDGEKEWNLRKVQGGRGR